MENLRAIFNKFFANLSEQWVKASTLKKGLAVALLLAVLGGVASLLLLKEADPYEYVFVDLPAEDVQSITTFFKRSNVVDYIADSKGIKVPSKDVMSLRIKLAKVYPRTGSSAGKNSTRRSSPVPTLNNASTNSGPFKASYLGRL